VNEKEERALERSVETEEWRSVGDLSGERKRFQAYAQATLKKDRRVNIRISEADLEGLQRKAVEEGLPYQTLLSSLIHKYVTGRLVDREPPKDRSER